MVLTAASVKMTVVWKVTLCRLVETDRYSKDAYYLLHRGDYKGRNHLRNVRQFLPVHTSNVPEDNHLQDG